MMKSIFKRWFANRYYREAEYREALTEYLEIYAGMIETRYPDEIDNLKDKALYGFICETLQEMPHHPLMKLNRWFGYIQGVLIERDYTTIIIERDRTRERLRPLDFGPRG